MKSMEGFFIGVALGFLLALAIVTMRQPINPPHDASCSCCEEYLDHISKEHK